jgi:hypothetical protein
VRVFAWPSLPQEDFGRGSTDDGVLLGSNVELIGLLGEIEKLLKKPLIDETGLVGRFDWDLQYEHGREGALVQAAREQLAPGVDARPP